MNKEQAFLEAQKMYEEQIAELKDKLEVMPEGLYEIKDTKSDFYAMIEGKRDAGRNGFTTQAVSAVCRGEKHTHKNYIWKYLEA